ncbi:EamA family transporter [Acetobacter conturbans]|uniref:EamA family transporter n=1 Tax=Acetobacter conturbans TaxID=1737472 RepID=A0ABX0K222_9PROT|nr:DMT family transporter [Acetobacter conturbans]NHN88353.1 EamA family transporter [Acetobacter conturbans]
MNLPPAFRSVRSELIPLAALLLSMISITSGVSFARSLFPIIGPAATTTLRLALAAFMLALIMRIWRLRTDWRSVGAALPYGIALGCMNMMFYFAIERIPLGVAMAVEFIGPLSLAVFFSRNRSDFLWVGLTVIGLFLLLPLRHDSHPIDPYGLLWSLGAGGFWAIYILMGKRAGAVFGSYAPALGMIIGTLTVLPFGLTHVSTDLLRPATIFAALALAALSGAIPYSLEMYALRKIPTKSFSVLTSAEPAVGAIMGTLMLDESLPFADWLGIAAIVASSLGTTLTSRKTVP